MHWPRRGACISSPKERVVFHLPSLSASPPRSRADCLEACPECEKTVNQRGSLRKMGGEQKKHSRSKAWPRVSGCRQQLLFKIKVSNWQHYLSSGYNNNHYVIKHIMIIDVGSNYHFQINIFLWSGLLVCKVSLSVLKDAFKYNNKNE